MAAIENRRKTDRRYTDQEVDEILQYAKGYVNGTRKRQMTLGASMATLLVISTLVNMWVVAPLKEDITVLKHEMMEIDKSVRSHHEEQASLYVSKDDEKKVYTELQALERKVDRIIEVMMNKR